eukprot:4277425-Pyramimonas_sp.AAC.1
MATAAPQGRGAVRVEWPSAWQYLRGPQVRKFLRANQFRKCRLHGCAYGLRDMRGNFMKKP